MRLLRDSYSHRGSIWLCCPQPCEACSFELDIADYLTDNDGLVSFAAGTAFGQADGSTLARPLARGVVDSTGADTITFTQDCIAVQFKVGDVVQLIDTTVAVFDADGNYDYAAGQFGAVEGNVLSVDESTNTIQLDAAPTAAAGAIVGVALKPLGISSQEYTYRDDILTSGRENCLIAVYEAGIACRERIPHYDLEMKNATHLEAK